MTTDSKHRLVEQTRRLMEAAMFLDVEVVDAAEIDELTAAVTSLADRAGRTRRSLANTLAERSPFSGRSNPLATPMTIERDRELTRASAVYGAPYEGPPETLHGGFVAGAFDDLLGAAQMASGRAGFTGTLTVKMRRPTPLHTRIDYEAGVKKAEGRKIVAWGKSYADGTLTAEAECLFVIPRDRYSSG